MLCSKARIGFHMEVHAALWYHNSIDPDPDPDDSYTGDFHDGSPGGRNLNR